MVFTWTVALATAGALVAPTALATWAVSAPAPAFAPVSGSHAVTAKGRFAPVEAFVSSPAVTYDLARVPAGAHVEVLSLVDADGSSVSVQVRGLLPNHVYGAHVHRYGCGPLPADAGPHAQGVADPVQPSVDPAYANPRNEIWLDLATDANGDARSHARVEWPIPPTGAGSIVLHEHATHTGPGEAGTAGARLACVSVPFDGAPSTPA